MIKKTKNYDLFVFRDDNREKIDQAHVKRLMHSIEMRNLLEFKPILVNESMQVIDGQHRLLAAKALGIEVYYDVQKGLAATDIIALNISKTWTTGDYLNYYIKNGNENYIRLSEFMQKEKLSLKIALKLISKIGESTMFENFKNGTFEYSDENISHNISLCWETIRCIKRFNGFSSYTQSSRFWMAMVKLFRHPEFIEKKWRTNMEMLVSKFGAKARTDQYEEMFLEIYNYRAQSKLDFDLIASVEKEIRGEKNPATRQEKIKTMVAKARQTSLFENVSYN